VELVLNGRYAGVYVLAERPKLTPTRVHVDDRDVSGGYLLEATVTRKLQRGDGPFRTSVLRRPIAYYDPERKDLSGGRAAWIRDYVGRFERALYGPQFSDPQAGYRAHLDVPAAVDYVLLNELFRNQDAFRASTFMHKGAGGRLALGPVWDFDLAMGNSPNPARNPVEGLILDRHPWSEQLYRDAAFVEALAARWREVRAGGLIETLLAGIDADAARLSGPQARNFRRWPLPRKWLRATPWPPRGVRKAPRFRAEVQYLKSWIQGRARWMDERFLM
jgi:hypothetical protein